MHTKQHEREWGWSARCARLPWLTPSRWRDLRRTLGRPFGVLSRRRRGRPLVRAYGSACARCPRAFVRPQARVRCPSPVACAPSAPAWGATAPRLVRRWGLVAPRFLFSGYAIPLALWRWATLRALAINQIARRGTMPPPSLWSGFAPLRTERALPAGRGCAWLASYGLVLAAARLRPYVVLSVVRCRASLNLWRRLVLAAYRVQWPTLRPFARGPRCPALPSGGAPTPRPRCPAPFGRTLRTAQGFGDSGRGVPPPFFVGYARPRQLRPACYAGTRNGGAGVSLICPSGRRAGRCPGTGAKRGTLCAAGLFWQTCGARERGDAFGCSLRATRRAGWGRAKPAIARFICASLIQPAPRYALRPFGHPKASPCSLFAPHRSASPSAHSVPHFSCPRVWTSPLITRLTDGHATPTRPRSAASRYARRGRCFRGLLRTARRCRRRGFSNCDVVGAVALLWSNNLKLSAGDNTDGEQHATKKKCRATPAKLETQSRRNFFLNSKFQKQR